MKPTDQPLISIIIPTYNSTSTIKNCLDSISKQDFNDYEVIIIDGDSTDETIDIVKSYEMLPALKLYSEPDKGIYDAMNKGILNAEGEYLYFLGSDDSLYNENVLSLIAGQLKKTNAKVLYGNVMMQRHNKNINEGFIHAGEFDLKRLLSDNICHQSIFYHNVVFKSIGDFSLKYPVFADYDLNLRCFANYKFHYTNTIIANFTIGGTSSLVTDTLFEKEKAGNIIKYFFKKLHTKAFVGLRLYLKRAALSGTAQIGFWMRLYCLLIYAKLKTQSLLT